MCLIFCFVFFFNLILSLPLVSCRIGKVILVIFKRKTKKKGGAVFSEKKRIPAKIRRKKEGLD